MKIQWGSFHTIAITVSIVWVSSERTGILKIAKLMRTRTSATNNSDAMFVCPSERSIHICNINWNRYFRHPFQQTEPMNDAINSAFKRFPRSKNERRKTKKLYYKSFRVIFFLLLLLRQHFILVSTDFFGENKLKKKKPKGWIIYDRSVVRRVKKYRFSCNKLRHSVRPVHSVHTVWTARQSSHVYPVLMPLSIIIIDNWLLLVTRVSANIQHQFTNICHCRRHSFALFFLLFNFSSDALFIRFKFILNLARFAYWTWPDQCETDIKWCIA